MFLAGAAARCVPRILPLLPLFGVPLEALDVYPIKGNDSPVRWLSQLRRQKVVEHLFDVGKVANGLSKADDLVTGLNLNAHDFMSQTYNLVRFLFERDDKNPHRQAGVRDLVFQYFLKLEEQDWQCCAGAMGRNFHVFSLCFMYLFEEHKKDLVRPEQERQARLQREQEAIEAQRKALEEYHRAVAEAAEEERVRLEQEFRDRLAADQNEFFQAEQYARRALVGAYNEPVILYTHGGRPNLNDGSAYGGPQYWEFPPETPGHHNEVDGRTANRLYHADRAAEEAKEQDRLAAEQKAKEAEQAEKESFFKSRDFWKYRTQALLQLQDTVPFYDREQKAKELAFRVSKGEEALGPVVLERWERLSALHSRATDVVDVGR